MRPLLITGGCGFIGSNFIRHFFQEEPSGSVINFDLLSYAGNLANLDDIKGNPRYHFEQGDIADVVAVRKALANGVSGVINFAAESHVDRSIADAAPFIRTNVMGTQALLEAVRELGVPRFLQISTDEVYGSLGPTGLFTEETPLAPNSPYAASKASADLLVRSYVHTYQLPAVITRCSNNYGPYQFPEKLLPLFITRLLRDEPVPIYGDGLYTRDWIHVVDHCAAILAVWREGKVGQVYNIGGRCEWTNLRLTQTLLRLMEKPAGLVRYVPDRPGHDRRYAIDCGKIERELGWRPTISFDQGLLETIEWYRTHADWVENIRSGAYRKPAGNAPCASC